MSIKPIERALSRLDHINSPISEDVGKRVRSCINSLFNNREVQDELSIDGIIRANVSYLSSALDDIVVLLRNPETPYIILKPNCIYHKHCAGAYCNSMQNTKHRELWNYLKTAREEYIQNHPEEKLDPDTLLRV